MPTARPDLEPGKRQMGREAATLLADDAGWAAFRLGRVMPKALLHSALHGDVWAAWSRGSYNDAILRAFMEVEIRVRDAAGIPASLTGVRLVRAAFATKDGPLTDPTVDDGEREATMHLFGGAIGAGCPASRTRWPASSR